MSRHSPKFRLTQIQKQVRKLKGIFIPQNKQNLIISVVFFAGVQHGSVGKK